jgi:Holliday junction resolvasome RuvABC endonuclease subunit
MWYLGIDTSLTGTGVALVNTTTAEVRTFTIRPPKDFRGGIRLNFIHGELERLIPASYFIYRACVEGYAYGGLGKLAELAEVGGVARLFLASRGIDYKVVAPAALKKYITGDSAAEKSDVILAVNTRYGSKLTDDNQADALALADIAKSTDHPELVVDRPAREVLNKLLTSTPKKRRKTIKKLTKNAL